MPVWQTTRHRIDLSRPRVMGIVNLTPDSFSDGGAFENVGSALRRCERLIAEGADILDLGAESTRPGSAALPVEEELARLLPVLHEALTLGVPVSVDTNKADVMRLVLDLGVDIVNDVWALRQPSAREVVAAYPSCGICLMHMHGEPGTMQRAPMEGDAVTAVLAFWREVTVDLAAANVSPERIVLDPGIGFGKSVAQNFSLLERQHELLAAGYPLLTGWSRKSSLGAASGIAVAGERVMPSIAAALLSVERGASIVRVHDVRATIEALSVWLAARGEAPASCETQLAS